MGKVISNKDFDDDCYLVAVNNFYDLIWDMDIEVPENVLEIYRELALAAIEDILGYGQELPYREGAVNYEVAAIQVAMYFSAPYRVAELFESYTGIAISLGD